MKSYYPEKAAGFEVSASMGFFLKAKDEKNYLKYCDSYVRDVISDNPLGLIKQARILLDNFPGSKKSMDAAEDIFALAANTAQNSEYYMLYADLLFRHGKAEKAMEALEQAEKIAIEEGADATTASLLVVWCAVSSVRRWRWQRQNACRRD